MLSESIATPFFRHFPRFLTRTSLRVLFGLPFNLGGLLDLAEDRHEDCP